VGLPYINYFKQPKNINPNKFLDYEEEVKLILAYFEDFRPYLKKNISINEISLALDIPLKLLSFIINQNFKLNFNDFVNKYRIEHVVQGLQRGDMERFTINSLSQEAGFSNKTTFLNAFKKVHNCNPSHYLKKMSA
jgi:AraC-like DNA-binding protein